MRTLVPYIDTSAHAVPARSVTLAARTRSHSISPGAWRAAASSTTLYGAKGRASESHSPGEQPVVKKRRLNGEAELPEAHTRRGPDRPVDLRELAQDGVANIEEYDSEQQQIDELEKRREQLWRGC